MLLFVLLLLGGSLNYDMVSKLADFEGAMADGLRFVDDLAEWLRPGKVVVAGVRMYAAPSGTGEVDMTITAMMQGLSHGTPISAWDPASGGGGDDGLASEAGREQSAAAGAAAATDKAGKAGPRSKRAHKRGRGSEQPSVRKLRRVATASWSGSAGTGAAAAEGGQTATRGKRAHKRDHSSERVRVWEPTPYCTRSWYSAIVETLDGNSRCPGLRRIVMTAPSGTGKTQTLYDIAARRHCVLLVLNTSRTAGVNDLQDALASFSSEPRTDPVSNTDWLARTLHGAVVARL